MKALLFLILIFPSLAIACQCAVMEASEIYSNANYLFVIEEDGSVVEENGIKFLTGKVVEVFKGNLKVGQNIKVDFLYKSSCEAASGINSKVLVASYESRDHGYPTSSICSMWALEPMQVGDELLRPSVKNTDLLNQFRQFSHNKAL